LIQLPFSGPLDQLLSPAMDALAGEAGKIAGLQKQERERIVVAARSNLMSVLHNHLARTLLLELHIARKEGRLHGASSVERWRYFIESASRPLFWRNLHHHYPAIPARIDRILHNRGAAAIAFARAWAADRSSLGTLCGGCPGLLQDLRFHAGDSHRQGRTVVIVVCEGGKLVYKPRPLRIDIALAGFLRYLADTHSHTITAAVPPALTREGHGWAAFVRHRYAENQEELRDFYRGIGQWLGILRLLGGTDMHAQNLIADGARPVIVDCETLFTPRPDAKPSGYGRAADHAAHWIMGTVLGTGMLPGRAQGLGWRGADVSSVGALPEQQPDARYPAILDAGTDEARWGTTAAPAPVAHNHPAPQPALAHYWPEVLDAFDRINASLRRLDASGLLRTRLDEFADCTVRIVPRSTETYAELARMLWHPVSLHNEESATQRAHDLLCRMAANTSIAPDDPTVIDAEIADLKQGDIPYFSAVAARGQLQGPGDTTWLEPRNLIEAALDHWRAANLPMERNIIHGALPGAYIGDDASSRHAGPWPGQPRMEDVEKRRRALLKAIMQDLSRHAIHGEDGTVTWLGPVFAPDTGWSIRPMSQDIYSGLAGLALLVAAYRHESGAGRADPIEGLDALLQGICSSLRMAEQKREQMMADRIEIRPLPPGAYVGLGGSIWTWLTLDTLGGENVDSATAGTRTARHGADAGTRHACRLALLMPQAAAASKAVDILYGLAGAIPPLLALAERTADRAYLDMAKGLGDQLCASAIRKDDRACWAQSPWPEGLGGFSHGATGVGWALSKLARASGDARYQELAAAAFAFEESLFDEQAQSWLDLRGRSGTRTTVAWCHGAVGIGMAHLDLDPDLQQASTRLLLRRAVVATWRTGLSVDHGICHGDASAWEFLDAAIAKGKGPAGVSREALLAQWLTRLEQHDVPHGIVSNTFARGLMTGASGIAYQLLRAEPRSDLPSVLTLGSAMASVQTMESEAGHRATGITA
jgi:type 2 lantibiotic biosynthesis protein LanM